MQRHTPQDIFSVHDRGIAFAGRNRVRRVLTLAGSASAADGESVVTSSSAGIGAINGSEVADNILGVVCGTGDRVAVSWLRS